MISNILTARFVNTFSIKAAHRPKSAKKTLTPYASCPALFRISHLFQWNFRDYFY